MAKHPSMNETRDILGRSSCPRTVVWLNDYGFNGAGHRYTLRGAIRCSKGWCRLATILLSINRLIKDYTYDTYLFALTRIPRRWSFLVYNFIALLRPRIHLFKGIRPKQIVDLISSGLPHYQPVIGTTTSRGPCRTFTWSWSDDGCLPIIRFDRSIDGFEGLVEGWSICPYRSLHIGLIRWSTTSSIGICGSNRR